ncbi:beta-1,3-glucanase family protein [Streptantibioticus silvisoli]|uniref:Beta-1,3-glucanase family protein n=1 Tax=Streptantibioticus silvisoli TaxID=2705255 RepID=A0ABT6W3B3_9ACTN|nr:beta-1,3-glucanase family protein [Streptantibioticus silvisoli]MDI5964472.1 beta-1,3-glucanase family protein [Streptantibioticus silvisoli]
MRSRRSFLATAAAGVAAAATAPLWSGALAPRAYAAGASLPISLHNNSGNNTVYAYISGSDSTGWPGFVGANGQFQRLPSPSSVLTPVADYSIPLGASGSATNFTLAEYVIGGRVWFSVGQKIQFFVNPPGGNGGVPGLVQPGFTSSDPNWQTDWTFCEFTYNSANLYANISYVDLVALPISMATTGSSGSQSVSPLPSGALASIASGLRAQHAADGAPWDQLVATDSAGNVLRVLSPTHSPTDFGSYWNSYLDSVWTHYETNTLTIDGQGSIGSYSGTVSGNVLTFAGLNDDGVAFTKPSAADIFGCASGPLYNSGGDARGAIAARLGAALNRSSLLVSGGSSQPSGVNASQYYQGATTNHYARLVHQYANVGYAFPYDDVGPTGAAPVDGHLQDGAPTSWTITLGAGGGGGTTPPPTGGTGAYATIQAESYSAQSGSQTESCSDTGGGQDVGFLSAGDWLKYSGIDFGSTSPKQFVARLASGAATGISGAVQVHLDSTTGTKIAEIDIGNNGGWQSWQSVPANTTGTTTGVHDVYLVFAGSTTDFVNINWFTFTK